MMHRTRLHRSVMGRAAILCLFAAVPTLRAQPESPGGETSSHHLATRLPDQPNASTPDNVETSNPDINSNVVGDSRFDRLIADVVDSLASRGASSDVVPSTRLLVRFKSGSGSAAQAAHARAGAQRIIRQLNCVRGLCVVDVPTGKVADALKSYRADPNVLYAESDHPIRILETPNDPGFSKLWGMNNTGQSVKGFFCFRIGTEGADIRAMNAWDVWTGDPDFRIAVIDTGVNYQHPDLAANIWTNPGEIPNNGIDDDGNGWVDDVHGYDFQNMDGDPMDDHRHGSHVAGTIGAVGNNGLGVVGVNQQCNIVALKIFDDRGRGLTSSAVMAMEYVIQERIRVSNSSWGCDSRETDCFSQALFDVIQASQAVDHLFVTAAGNDFGNDNDENPFYPASYALDNIITVAALSNRDTVAIFSNVGPTSVDLAAPGTCIYSTFLGDNYGFLDGTSMAAPHVTGVVGLMLSRIPELDWRQARTRLLRTVRPVGALMNIVRTGGVVDAGAAVWDCNTNGVPDEQDIASGSSSDCNGNLLPDECEPDCNGNDVADECDIVSGTSSDCSLNGIPDECEPDCNGNGKPDSCDIADQTSLDCDGVGNGIPDECEPDCNMNGAADSCDVDRGAADCNRNGVPDECETGGLLDCNGNATPDLCDVFLRRSADCNENAVPDECDFRDGTSQDCTGNGVLDECEPDCNGNGVADSCDIADGTSTDCSGNRIPDECEPNCNLNRFADICDIRSGRSRDCNHNNVPDECEPGGGGFDDCNVNGLPDLCDIFNGTASDCNSNHKLDQCDVESGEFLDTDGDGLLDVCEGKGFRLVPVSASGGHTIDGNEIILDSGGQTVALEMRLSGWDLSSGGDVRLRGYQPEIDVSGFTGGLYGQLSLARIACVSDDDCAGWQSACQDDGFCDAFGSVFVDDARPDFVFADALSVWVTNFVTQAPNILVLAALFSRADAVVDEGLDTYAATMLLDVSPVAGGTFEVGFVEHRSFLGDQDNDFITVPSFGSAVITIPSDCNGNGIADELDVAEGNSEDCNGNGIPDECLTIEPDCNSNQRPDDCDIVDGVSVDCSGDGVPDECDPDCNVNGIPDSCDIASGDSDDINSNGVPDECEPARTIYVDQANCFFPGSGVVDDPFCSIQVAIESMGNGRDGIVDIVVADGIYTGVGNKNIEFGGRALTLRSAGGPAGCVIDCGGEGRAMVFAESDDDVRVQGFTIVNGSAGSGGAVFCDASNPTLSHCVFRDNVATRFGGAIYCTNSSPLIDRCTITQNVARQFYGGAVYAIRGGPVMTECIVDLNDADLGGAVFGFVSSPTLRQCTVTRNTARSRGGALYFAGVGSRPSVNGTIVWGNDAPVAREVFVGGAAVFSVQYSDIAGGLSGAVVGAGSRIEWGPGSIDGNPRFGDAAAGDYHLTPDSACIDGGDPTFVPVAGQTDFDGEARVMLAAVDMGVDEAPSFTDCNGNSMPDGREVADRNADCNDNRVLDDCDLGDGVSVDLLPADGDGIPDECQADCDANGQPDAADLATGRSEDCNVNDVPDACDIGSSVSLDILPSGGDGIPDECQEDCNANDVPDDVEMAGGGKDCNGNEHLDECDISDLSSADCDGNLVPDECEIYGDVNHDSVVNLFDAFCVLEGFAGRFVDCSLGDVDIGGCQPDGVVDLFDLFGVLDGFAGVNACCP